MCYEAGPTAYEEDVTCTANCGTAGKPFLTLEGYLCHIVCLNEKQSLADSYTHMRPCMRPVMASALRSTPAPPTSCHVYTKE